MATRKQRPSARVDEQRVVEPRWELQFRVFHPADDRCARSNSSPDDRCGYVCAVLIEILRDWELTDSTATTLRHLLETIGRLPSFNDVDNRSYWPSETDDDALWAPTLSRDALAAASRELQELRLQRPDPRMVLRLRA